MNRKSVYMLFGAGLLSASLASPALADRCETGHSKKSNACASQQQHSKKDQKQHQKQVQKQVQKNRHKQATKKAATFHRGDRIAKNHERLQNPRRYGLRSDHTYVVVEKQVYRIDPDTRAVLSIIGALKQLGN